MPKNHENQNLQYLDDQLADISLTDKQKIKYIEFQKTHAKDLAEEGITDKALHYLPDNFATNELTTVSVVKTRRHPDPRRESPERYSIRFSTPFVDTDGAFEADEYDVAVAEDHNGDITSLGDFDLEEAEFVAAVVDNLETADVMGQMSLREDLSGVKDDQYRRPHSLKEPPSA